MSGNFIASRISGRVGIRGMVLGGLVLEALGGLAMVGATYLMPSGGPATIFLPQVLISVGNGIMLPNAIAGAVSVRPHAAGAAAGITGFTQWAIGDAAAQVVTMALAGAPTALPMALMIAGSVILAPVVFLLLVRGER